MSRAEASIEIPALGRPFQLGMLYDCRSDSRIPGITLWDLGSLQKDLCLKPQPKTESEIIASDSIDDKANALNVSASLKVSLMSGMIEVEGSAKYLNDTKKSQRQARVTLQYKATTKFEQLTMSHLGTQNVSYPAVFDQGTATHVVTAVLYGAQAFFVFDREVSSNEEVQDIQGKLKFTMQKAISITGQAEVQLNEEEKSHAENFSCKFHGDFSLDSNPLNFQDAMKVYATLPKMLGQDGEKAVPVRVWLYPLTKLDSKAAQLVREISLTLVFDAQAVMEQLTEINMRCNDLANDPMANTFPEIKKKIQQFKDLCKQQKQIFQKELAGILPSIRGGGKEERALVDILTAINQSPFNSQRLTEFLNTKEREMNFVKSYLSILQGMDILSSQNKLEEIVFGPKHTFVVSFIFTSLHDEEPFIASMQDHLLKQHVEKRAGPSTGSSVPEKYKAWFEDNERNQSARRSAKAISDFARINQSNQKIRYVVASVPDQGNPGASVYLYEEAELISRRFELPSKPLPPLIGEIGHDSVQLTFQPADYGRANISSYRVEYRLAGEENWTTVETVDSQERFPVAGLHLNTEYQFQYTAKSKPGLSETSTSTSVKTFPTSPPGKPRIVAVEPCRIFLVWDGPKVTGEGVLVQEYKVEYREVEGEESPEGGKDPWAEQRTGGKTETCHIERLKPQTAYRFRVSAVCVDGATSAASEEVEISTQRAEEEGSQRIAQKYLQESTLIENGQPSLYALPFKNATSAASKAGLTYFLGRESWEVPNKVIVVLGPKGSGKTTLVNAMVNYVLGVKWRDSFRFKLVPETTEGSPAESPTSKVTAYMVNHRKGFQVPYSLTIIDTPGFVDPRGVEHHQWLTRQIQEFFSVPGGIDHLDAICIVVQASSARLPYAPKYLLDSLLSFLGKDVKDSIHFLITFSDWQTPPLLESIAEADTPCTKDAKGRPVHFKFNNSALFANNFMGSEDSCNFEETFWKMGRMSMKAFLDSLNTAETKSLTSTKEVLQEWEELEDAVVGLQTQLDTGLVKLEELRKTQEALYQQMDNMAASTNAEPHEGEEMTPKEVDIDGTKACAVICSQCAYTCCFPCPAAGGQDKPACDALDPATGSCTVCPGQCPWSVHLTQQHKLEQPAVKAKRTQKEQQEQDQSASDALVATEKALEVLSQEFEGVKDAAIRLLRKVSQSRQCIRAVALKPSPLSAPEYIDPFLKAAEADLKSGHEERIQTLREARQVAELIEKVTTKEALRPEEEALYAQLEGRKRFPLSKKFMKPMVDICSWFK